MQAPSPLQTLTSTNTKDALVVIDSNYKQYHSLVVQREGLQEWVREQEKVWNKK